MHYEVAFGGIELITGLSYLLILLGFALRQYLEGSSARLLWPWMLVSIFGLCGLTRLHYVGVIASPEMAVAASHLILAAVALAYGVGQLLYAFWPELFEDDTPMPRLARPEPEGIASVDAEPLCGTYQPQVVTPTSSSEGERT